MNRLLMYCVAWTGIMGFGLGSLSPNLLAATNAELKIGMTQEFENPNPLIMQMMATTYIYLFVGRSLNTLDADAKVVEQLAVKTPRLTNGLARWIGTGKDKKLAATWEIRPDAVWGDGEPITGHDVAFTLQVGLSPNVSIGERERFENIERIEIDKENPKKFTVYYKKAKWDYYKAFGDYILPRHIEEPIFKKFGDQPQAYGKNSEYIKNPSNPGLYSGPYRVKEVKLASHVILEPNPKYYGKKPAIQRIILKFIPNTATLEANLRSGTIDMVSILGFTFDQALAFEKRMKKENLALTVNYKPGLVYEHLDCNLRNPILKDVQVRKALMYGVNREALCEALFEKKQTKALHILAPVDPWFTNDPKKMVHYPYSRRKARKLLEAAGWKEGKDGFRYKDGKKLSLRLMTTAGNKSRENVEAYLQSAWKGIGVEIIIKNEPAKVYFGETVRKAKYPALAMYAWISSPESSPRSQLHSERIPTEKNGYSGQNSCGWKNAEVDQLVETLETEFDAAKRLEKIHKILYHYTNEVPVLPLYYRSDVSVTPKNLKGYRLTGHQFASPNHVEDWVLE